MNEQQTNPPESAAEELARQVVKATGGSVVGLKLAQWIIRGAKEREKVADPEFSEV